MCVCVCVCVCVYSHIFRFLISNWLPRIFGQHFKLKPSTNAKCELSVGPNQNHNLENHLNHIRFTLG